MSQPRFFRRIFALAFTPVIFAALSGCSQIASLTPVSGGPLQTVRVAVLDVLVQQQVPILVAPVCVLGDTQFTCEGSTVDGDSIRAEATLSVPYSLVLTVGSEIIYSGDVQSIIDQAAKSQP